jgi:hypothetical protein
MQNRRGWRKRLATVMSLLRWAHCVGHVDAFIFNIVILEKSADPGYRKVRV